MHGLLAADEGLFHTFSAKISVDKIHFVRKTKHSMKREKGIGIKEYKKTQRKY